MAAEIIHGVIAVDELCHPASMRPRRMAAEIVGFAFAVLAVPRELQ